MTQGSCSGQHLMGHIERHHGDRHAAAHHDIGGLGVHVDVEFGDRRGVTALEIAAAHHHDLLDAGDGVRGHDEGHGDVGERPERAKGDRLRRVTAQSPDDEVHAIIMT